MLHTGGRLRRAEMRRGEAPKGAETRRILWSGACCNTHAGSRRSKPSRWRETTRTERGAVLAGRSQRRPRRGLREWTPGIGASTEGWSLNTNNGVVGSASDGRPDANAGNRERDEARSLQAVVARPGGWGAFTFVEAAHRHEGPRRIGTTARAENPKSTEGSKRSQTRQPPVGRSRLHP